MVALRFVAAGVACSLIVGISQACVAGVIGYTKITNDPNAGISAANTYTHAVDFQASGDAASVNGVSFDAYTGSGDSQLPITVTASSVFGVDGDSTAKMAGDISAVFEGFVFDVAGTGSRAPEDELRATLTGLDEGQQYELRIYTQPFSGSTRDVRVVFDPDGSGPISDATPVLNQEDARSVPDMDFAEGDSYYISYTYEATATGSIEVSFDQQTNDSWILYGLTNQVAVVPTPEALTALGGGLLLMARRPPARAA